MRIVGKLSLLTTHLIR